jgi:cardiolipin synthase (CMP-forming)
MGSRTLTTANQITLLRLAFIPFFAIAVLDHKYRAALILLIAAALSDVVDGTVARVFHQETALGMALDPIADKVLMTTAYLMLAFREALPWWLTILVVSRDVAIVVAAVVISLVAGYRTFRPTMLGKSSTVAQVSTVFAAVSYNAHVPLVSAIVVHFLVYLAAALTVASGVHYVFIVRRRADPQPPGPAVRT